jgi:type II secretory pathway component PulF
MIAYPAFVGTIVIAATFFLMVYMVPQLKMFVKNMGQVLPLQTQILFFVSDLLVAYWYLLLLLPLLAFFGVRCCCTQPAGAVALRRHQAARAAARRHPAQDHPGSRFANTLPCSTPREYRSSSRSARRRTSSATWSFARVWSASNN